VKRAEQVIAEVLELLASAILEDVKRQLDLERPQHEPERVEPPVALSHSVPAAAKRLGISRSHLYELIRAGKGPRVTRLGRRTLITEQELERWIREQ
jgi:excisionase family DNA binding protein